jgi:hypothetical protein
MSSKSVKTTKDDALNELKGLKITIQNIENTIKVKGVNYVNAQLEIMLETILNISIDDSDNINSFFELENYLKGIIEGLKIHQTNFTLENKTKTKIISIIDDLIFKINSQSSPPTPQSSQTPSQSSQSSQTPSPPSQTPPQPPSQIQQMQVESHQQYNCTYYNTTSQKFIFPPCFLKHKTDALNKTFFDEANLNMIIFELLIKLVDFMHDNVKDIDRIRKSDEIIFDMFARKKKATKAKALQSSKKIGGMLTDDNTSSSNIPGSFGSTLVYTSSSKTQPKKTSSMTDTLLNQPSETTYDVASIQNAVDASAEHKNVKDQFPYIYYEMDDLFSIYINKILALLSPELLEYIKEINDKIEPTPPTENEKIDENKKFDENEESNTILFSSIIYIINVLITPYTGEYENNMYLTNFTIKQEKNNKWVVDGDINEDINEDVNESDKSSSFGVKICKKAIMQSFIDIFLNNNGTGQSTNFFEILKTNYYTIYDKFIDYVEIYFCNELCSSNGTTSQYGGGISMQKVVEIVNKSSPKSGGTSKIINNIIIRLYVITLLKEFNIVKSKVNLNGQTNYYNYEYTDFGNAIINAQPDYYAVNYINDPVNNAMHWSLVILDDILSYFKDIVEDKVNELSSKFNKDFKSFEDKLWSNLYLLSSTIPGFYLERIDCKEIKKNENCCANKFILSNASTTVNLNEGNPCVFNSLASVLDPAGSTNIDMTKNKYEYGNINCLVYGTDNDGKVQTNICFNGKIDFLEIEKNDGNTIYYLSNKSNNTIKELNVQCSIQVDYEKDGTTDVYTEIKKDETKTSFSRFFGSQSVEVPQSTELSSTRKQMTYNLLNALSANYPSFYGQSSSAIYTKSLYDPNNKKYVEGLFGSTLNKTVGDLMQILTSLIKYGGITSFPSFLNDKGFSSSVIGYNDTGDALREINHHDLTASIINLFMLIFGSYTFDMQEGSFAKYYINPGKNEGSYMADHRTSFQGFGTTENIHNTIVQHNKARSDCNISNLKIVKIVDFEKQKNLEKEAEDLKKEVENLKKELANSRAPPIVEISDSLSSIKSDSSTMDEGRSSSSTHANNQQSLSSSSINTLPDKEEPSSKKRTASNSDGELQNQPKRPLLESAINFFWRKKTGGKTNKNHYIKIHKTSIKSKIKQNKKSLKKNKHKKNSNTYKNK